MFSIHNLPWLIGVALPMLALPLLAVILTAIDPGFSTPRPAIAYLYDEVVEYDDLIATHEQAIIDGLIHSDETPLDIEGQQS